jgi:diguanylate cyclase (GGDEF)-like protein
MVDLIQVSAFFNGSWKMEDHFGDARVEELKLLSEIDRCGKVVCQPPMGPRRDLIAYLMDARFVNDLHEECQHEHSAASGGGPGDTGLERQLHTAHIISLSKVLSGREVSLQLAHRGRVRLSELKQALRSGREREPFGILWDQRHWELDLQIAVLDIRKETPLSLAFLDMNGLKQVNDTLGHPAGNLAIQAFFQAVASVVGNRGEAYRVGGDEVLVILPAHNADGAVGIIRLACTKLIGERLQVGKPAPLLSIAAGVITCTDANASPKVLYAAADAVQYRAKEESKKATPRHSVIALDGQKDMVVIPHQDEASGNQP